MRKFTRVYVEITNICNLHCSFCIGNQRPPQVMSVDAFRHILKALKGHTKHIYLHVLGEPLCHPQLREILATAEEEEFTVNLTTNGTLLEVQAEVLLSSKAVRKISVSLHSMEEGNGYKEEDYLKQVAIFAKEATKVGKYCELRYWNLGVGLDNRGSLGLLLSFLGLPQDFPIDWNKGNITLGEKLFLGKAEQFQWPSLDVPYVTPPPTFCHGLRSQIGVLCDGTVIPCCLDSKGDMALGNLFQNTLDEIVEGQRAMAIYEGFTRHKAVEELCKRCGYGK